MDGLAMSNGCKKRRGYADFAAGKMMPVGCTLLIQQNY